MRIEVVVFAIVLGLLIGLLIFVSSGCTPQDRSHCGFCKLTGLCTLLGDDPNLQRHEVYDWTDPKNWPAEK